MAKKPDIELVALTKRYGSTVAVDAIRERFGKTSVGSGRHVNEEGIQVPARRDAPWGPDE